MAKKFNLGDYIEQTGSKLDRLPRMAGVELRLIDADPSNFYSMDGIDALADNIATVGLLEPLRVREKDGRFIVLSGHRRRAALLKLVERGELAPSDSVPAFLDDEPDTGAASDKDAARIALKQLRLIYANSDNRQYSPADKSREVRELAAIFGELKRLGYALPGKTREQIAAAAKISESRVARLSVIENRLRAPNLRRAFEEGQLGENAAYEIARRDPAVVERADAAAAFLCRQTIEQLGAVLDGYEKEIASERDEVKSVETNLERVATGTDSDFDAEAYLQERAEEDAAFREGVLSALEFFFSPLDGVCNRQDGISLLKEKLGRIHASTWRSGPRIECSPRGVQMWDEEGLDAQRTWTEVYDILAAIAINGAKVSGTVEMAEPAWKTGEPQREGYYVCWASYVEERRKWSPDWEILYWRDGWFDTRRAANNQIPSHYEVCKWWPAPRSPEEEDDDE